MDNKSINKEAIILEDPKNEPTGNEPSKEETNELSKVIAALADKLDTMDKKIDETSKKVDNFGHKDDEDEDEDEDEDKDKEKNAKVTMSKEDVEKLKEELKAEILKSLPEDTSKPATQEPAAKAANLEELTKKFYEELTAGEVFVYAEKNNIKWGARDE